MIQTARHFDSPSEVFAHWSRLCEAGVVRLDDLDLNVAWSIRGPAGGSWQFACREPVVIRAVRGAGNVERASELEAPAPIAGGDFVSNCMVELAAEDFLRLARGELNPQVAFLDQRLKVAGPLKAVLRINLLLRRLLGGTQ